MEGNLGRRQPGASKDAASRQIEARQEPGRSQAGAGQEPARRQPGVGQEPARRHPGARQEPSRSQAGARQEQGRSQAGAMQDPLPDPCSARHNLPQAGPSQLWLPGLAMITLAQFSGSIASWVWTQIPKYLWAAHCTTWEISFNFLCPQIRADSQSSLVGFDAGVHPLSHYWCAGIQDQQEISLKI